MTDELRTYHRLMLRSAFQSLFWNVLLTRKRQTKFTLKALADALGINKSYVSRSFATPPNWQLDKISDMSNALGVDLIVEARDRKTGVIYTPNGIRQTTTTSSSSENVHQAETGSVAPSTTTGGSPDRLSFYSIVGTEVA